MSTPDTATRRWKLRGYAGTGKDQKLVHQSTCRGDRALDEAYSKLEHDQRAGNISRITVEPAW